MPDAAIGLPQAPCAGGVTPQRRTC